MAVSPVDTDYEAGRMPITTNLFGLEAAMYRYFEKHYPTDMQHLREMGVLGREAVEAEKGPWDNIASHCMLVALICLILARLVGLSAAKTRRLVSTALTHDAAKRKNREAINAAPDTAAKNELTRQFELQNTGLAAVTSIDMRRFLNWGVERLILRLADSYAGQTKDGLQTITSWRTRIGQLIERDRTGVHGHKGHSQDIGDRLYNGRPFYEVLFMVSEHCEIVLFGLILKNRHDYATGGWKVENMQLLLEKAIDSVLKDA